QVGADGAVDEREGRGLGGGQEPAVEDAAAQGVAAIAAGGAGAAGRLVVDDRHAGEGGAPAALVGEAAAAGEAAVAADGAGPAPRPGAGLGVVGGPWGAGDGMGWMPPPRPPGCRSPRWRPLPPAPPSPPMARLPRNWQLLI